VRDFLARHPDLSLTRCVGVLRVDQQERWLRGERVAVEDYLQPCCLPRASEEHAIDLVYGEFLLRQRLGEAPDLEEYARRFPQFAERLRLQVELHRALQAARGETPSAVEAAGEFDDRRTIPQPLRGPHTPATDLPSVPGYEVLDRLGGGGMGVVYRARQIGLRRPVALKMLRAEASADGELLARFRAESALLARLQHPNIVQVHEVGEHQGRPFIALEYVEGGSLDRKLAGNPQPAEEAAQLMQAVARAVQYAHERGIVHRDLKPHNVLLAEDGSPKVTDFGLAKLLAEGAGLSSLRCQTRTGAILGTPSYMAPEQTAGSAGEVGPQADVYALGAILYELLTGRPPHQGATALETLEQVRTQEPVPPSRLQPRVPRDLDTITLKCLRKEPHRRYPSAQALADDLQRFREGRPVLARPTGTAERLWRWCRRNPVVACLTAALVLAVAAGFGAVTWLWWQADADRAEAVRQRDRAARHFGLARQAVDRYCTFVSENRLLKEPKMEALRRDLLQAAVEFYARLVQESEDDPEVRLEQGLAHIRLAQITGQIARRAEAVRLAEQGLTILQRLAEDFPANLSYAKEVARGQHVLATLHNSGGRFDLAETYFRKALAGAEKFGGGRQDDPDNQGARAAIHASLGLAYHGQGRIGEAEAAFAQALALQERFAASQPGHRVAGPNLVSILLAYATVYSETDRLARAEPLARRAVQLCTELRRADPDNPDLRAHLIKGAVILAQMQGTRGLYREALASYRQAEAEMVPLAAAHPLVSDYRHTLALIQHGLGRCHASLGSAGDSEAAFRSAADFWGRLRKDHPDSKQYPEWLGKNVFHLGRLYASASRPEEALAAFRQAAGLWGALGRGGVGGRDWRADQATALHHLSKCLHRLGRKTEFTATLRSVVDLRQAVARDAPGAADAQEELAMSQVNLAYQYLGAGRWRDAEPLLRAALAISESLTQTASPPGRAAEITTDCWLNLAALHQLLGRRDEAEKALDTALPLCDKLKPPAEADAEEQLRCASRWVRAAQVALALSRLPQTRAALLKARAPAEWLARARPGEADPALSLGKVYAQLGELEAAMDPAGALKWHGLAVRALRVVLKVRPDHGAQAREMLAVVHYNRSVLQLRGGRPAEALASCAASLGFAEDNRAVCDHITVIQAGALAVSGDHAAATRAARTVRDSPHLSGEELCSLATVHTHCLALLSGQRARPGVDWDERWAAEAVYLLRRAQAAGRFVPGPFRDWLERGPQLDGLRRREDFLALLAEVRRTRPGQTGVPAAGAPRLESP
jgi:serine/threonine-protein kinase